MTVVVVSLRSELRMRQPPYLLPRDHNSVSCKGIRNCQLPMYCDCVSYLAPVYSYMSIPRADCWFHSSHSRVMTWNLMLPTEFRHWCASSRVFQCTWGIITHIAHRYWHVGCIWIALIISALIQAVKISCVQDIREWADMKIQLASGCLLSSLHDNWWIFRCYCMSWQSWLDHLNRIFSRIQRHTKWLMVRRWLF